MQAVPSENQAQCGCAKPRPRYGICRNRHPHDNDQWCGVISIIAASIFFAGAIAVALQMSVENLLPDRLSPHQRGRAPGDSDASKRSVPADSETANPGP